MKNFLYSKTICLALFICSLFVSVNAQSLKVMTYNIRLDVASDKENRWDNRKEFLASQIGFYDPDILGIQEALPNQVNDLESMLTKYDHVGIGRDGEGKGEASAIFYDPNRFRILQQSTFWLSETLDKVSKGWDASYIRICTYALLRDKKTKKTFWVFNTHLDNNGAVARAKGIEMILAKIKEVNSKNYPVIFMGDFNAEPSSELVEKLKKVMLDTRDISEQKPFGPSGTFNAFKYNEPVTRVIDYIFIDNSRRFSVKKCAVPFRSFPCLCKDSI